MKLKEVRNITDLEIKVMHKIRCSEYEEMDKIKVKTIFLVDWDSHFLDGPFSALASTTIYILMITNVIPSGLISL